MAFHVACPITCRRICNCKLGFPSELRSEKGQIEFLEAASRVDAIFKNPSLIYGKPKSVQVLVPKVVVASPPPLPLPPPIQAIVTPNASAIVDVGGVGDAAEELLSAQTKRAAMQKKAAAASVAAEDFARRFESGDMAEGVAKDLAADEQGLSNAKVMCRLCFSGENEGSERARKMLPCKTCNKKYHRSCVKSWAQNRDLFHWSSWACPSCRTCEVCRRTGDPNKLMFCKRCDGAHHCYCQQPPHKNVSSGPYLCPKHTKCHSCASTVPGNGLSVRWFLGYTCCDACGRLFVKGNYCPVCLKVYRDSESTPMVCCDICQRWVHCHCDGISDEKYLQFQVDNNLQYRCATCRGECYQVRDLEDAVQELWRRRDKADRELTASLRAAAGLPTQEEIFSIQPYSDDEDNKPSSKNEFGRSLKFSLKGVVDKSPKKNKESLKKSGNKKSVQKKGLHGPVIEGVKSERNVNRVDTMNENGKLSNNTKGPKLVIHLGSRNKSISNSPRSDASNLHKDQELLASNGVSDHHHQHHDYHDQTKGLKLRGKEGNTIKIRKLNPEVSVGGKKNTERERERERGRAPHTSELKPLLRLKFKNPYSENQTSWGASGEDDKSCVKGQRSKRKRPSSYGKEDEDEDDMMMDDDIMDANWIIQKLGKDAIGKKVEVHQPLNNTWRKGVVIEVFEGTSVVSVTLDEGKKTSNVDLEKQGIRFVSQKQRR
ncbi:unnamed protein product [Lactuca saligna]|uniref:Histone-lysine N-methyltransferase n=1 Tax=Lactuca saligna TaxID=75948 RepID=A0AA36E1X4_LACSI|nr:unnamed protein product [Lactuca saligna]